MADFDDEKPKDNTSPQHKPKFAKNKTLAPGGSLGVRDLGFTPHPSDTVQIYDITVRVAVDGSVAEEQTDAEKRAAYLNDLPEDTVFTSETGDKDVDQQSTENGEVPVTEKELEALKSGEIEPELEGPQISQSDFAKNFRKARGQTQQLEQNKGQELE